MMRRVVSLVVLSPLIALVGCQSTGSETSRDGMQPYEASPSNRSGAAPVATATPRGYGDADPYAYRPPTSNGNSAYATTADTTPSNESISRDPAGYVATPTPTAPRSNSRETVLTPTTGYAATASDNVYVVQKGDTLYGLARQFYQDQGRWRDIFAANRARLANPNTIQPGMKLIIP